MTIKRKIASKKTTEQENSSKTGFIHKVLLVVSPMRESKEAINRAIELAEQIDDSELIALFVIDKTIVEKTMNEVMSSGWLGNALSEDFKEMLYKEYKIQGKKILSYVEDLAQLHNIPYQTIILEGNLEDILLDFIKRYRVDHLVITRKRRLKIMRMLLGSTIEKIKSCTECNVDIIEG